MSLALHELSETSHRVLNPLREEQLVELGRVVRLQPGARVLDLGCGKGELLCRWAHEFGTRGTGVDVSPVFLAAARRRAVELGVAEEVSLIEADASTWVPDGAAYDIGSCNGATWIGDGVPGTLALLRQAVRPDGLFLIGEPFWREPPPPGALEAVRAGPEEFASLDGTLDRFEAAGTELVELVAADEHSWDRYAAAQWWNLREWLDANPTDSRAGEVRAFLDQERRGYLRYLRRFLGWAVFVLRPTS